MIDVVRAHTAKCVSVKNGIGDEKSGKEDTVGHQVDPKPQKSFGERIFVKRMIFAVQ